MKDIVRFFDGLPLILKLVFALPGIDGIAYGIYRIAKGSVILGLIWIILGATLFWIIDIVSILLYGKVKILVSI
jgi:hypothetical protein